MIQNNFTLEITSTESKSFLSVPVIPGPMKEKKKKKVTPESKKS